MLMGEYRSISLVGTQYAIVMNSEYQRGIIEVLTKKMTIPFGEYDSLDYYNKVQTHSVIRTIEETHYYETGEDRRVETLDGCAEADSATEADAAERSGTAAKDTVKQQGYVYKGHSCEYPTHDEGER
jgi:hypothetical protein